MLLTIMTVLVAIAIAVLLMPLVFGFTFIRGDKDDYLEITLLIFSRIRLRHRIYLKAVSGNLSKTAVPDKQAPDQKHPNSKKRRHPNSKDWSHQLSFWTEILKLSKPVLQRFKKTLLINQFRWQTRFGLGDPFYTGTGSGLIWSAKGILLGFLDQQFTFRQPPVLSVVPDFSKPCLFIRFEVDIQTKLYRLISAGTRLVFIFITGGRLKKTIRLFRKNKEKKH